MKNLKKALVLVLAFAMIFGMFTMNASAASFADDEDIVNTEAVGAMTQLGIINGYEDGTFLPNQVVTRAEMCKMISVAMNGGTAPIVDSSTVMFSDTRGHWANGYISYCFNKGVVSGDAGKGGAFRPDAAVTGTEAAKMILIALGYNSVVAGFTGAEWANNVSSAANDRGLFSGLGNLNVTAGLSRDNAAQMIYNGINAEMVKYDNILGTDANGQLTSTPTISVLSGKTILSEKYKVIKVEGVVTANEFMSGETLKGKTTIMVTNTAGINQYGAGTPKASAPATFKTVTGANEVGKTIALYVKPATSAPNDAVQATVVGTPTVSSLNKVYTTSKKLVNDTSKANDIAKTLQAAGLKFEDGATNRVTTYSNYAVETAGLRVTNRDAASTNIGNWVNNLGVDAQYIDNDGDGIIEVVTYLTYSFGKVASLSSINDGTLNVTVLGSANVALNSRKANTQVVGFAGLAVKDYVKYYKVGALDKYVVEKMTGVTVDVVSTTGEKVNTADKTYEISSLASASDISADSATHTKLNEAVSIGKSAVFYLDNAGAVIYVDSVKKEVNYLMLTAVSSGLGSFSDTITAKAVLQDGTVEVITVSKVGTTKIDSTTAAAQRVALDATDITKGSSAVIYTYSKDSNGKYELTAAAVAGVTALVYKPDPNGATAGGIAFTNNTPTIVAGASGIIADNNTPIVIGNSTLTTFTAYEGIGAAPSRTDAPVFALVDATTRLAKVVFTYGGAGAVSNDNYVYALSATPTITKDSNNADVFTYDVVRNGEVTTLVGTSATLFPVPGVYLVTLTGTKASSATTTDANNQIVARATVTTASNGVIGNTNGSYLYNDATKFFIISGSKATPTTVDAIVTSGPTADEIAMVLGTVNTAEAGTAKAVYIVRNNISGLAAGNAANARLISSNLYVDVAGTVTLNTVKSYLTASSNLGFVFADSTGAAKLGTANAAVDDTITINFSNGEVKTYTIKQGYKVTPTVSTGATFAPAEGTYTIETKLNGTVITGATMLAPTDSLTVSITRTAASAPITGTADEITVNAAFGTITPASGEVTFAVGAYDANATNTQSVTITTWTTNGTITYTGAKA